MVLVYDSYFDESKLESGPTFEINEDEEEIENED